MWQGLRPSCTEGLVGVVKEKETEHPLEVTFLQSKIEVETRVVVTRGWGVTGCVWRGGVGKG
jgi:hypothetical protein